MSINVPTIEDLIKETINVLKELGEDLEIVKRYNSLDSPIVKDYQIRIDREKKLLEKFKAEVRDIQLGKLGIN